MIKTTTRHQKSQKPIDFDIHLKYKCPNCSQEHWVKYLQAATKNFIVVCDCGTSFKIKTLSGFKLAYQKKKSIEKETKKQLPLDTVNKVIKALENYGFEKLEIQQAIEKAYSKHGPESIVDLVKHTLEAMRTEQ